MKLFESLNLKTKNYIIFGAGIALIILGYILMSIGEHDGILSSKLSPIVLIIGYCILIPISIFKNFKDWVKF